MYTRKAAYHYGLWKLNIAQEKIVTLARTILSINQFPLAKTMQCVNVHENVYVIFQDIH